MKTVFIDTETGGLGPVHPTIQIAAIAVENGEIIGEFERKLHFEPAKCEPEALSVNSYDPEIWEAEAVSPSVAMKGFCSFLEDFRDIEKVSARTGNAYRVARCAGHNVSEFDLPRLMSLAKNSGCFLPLDYRCLDTLHAAVWHFHGAEEVPPDFKLTTLARYFGLGTDLAHDALADCHLSWGVAKEIVKTFR